MKILRVCHFINVFTIHHIVKITIILRLGGNVSDAGVLGEVELRGVDCLTRWGVSGRNWQFRDVSFDLERGEGCLDR